MPEAVKAHMPPQLKFAVIDGSAGVRCLLGAFLQTEWPHATIEEVDPFAETLRGIGFAFGTNSDVILLGGIGTTAEACSSLQRLRSREHCPPVILMVARELESQAAMLIEAGASSVLFKDAFSKRSLIDSIRRLLGETAGGERSVRSVGQTPAPFPDTRTFGQFSFIANGQCHTVVIEHVHFLATLSNGKFAQVFSAERIEDRARVVVKISLTTPLHGAEVRAFCERYRLITKLDGQNVVRYVDAGVADSWPYVVLEHLSGGDLRRRMAAGISPTEAVQILNKLAAALANLHAGNFAHMDLKPENIFFRGDDMVLIDFNISTRFGHVARSRAIGDVFGSPSYMSPEQGQGLVIDGRSDLYSAGVIFYEMLTGTEPYAGESAIQLIYKHVHEEIPLLPTRQRRYQPIIDALMAKDRDARVASAADLGAMLLPYLTSDACYASP